MCQFFSFVSDGNGNCYFFDSATRKEMIKKNRGDYVDSHSVIASDLGLDPDKVNKFEFNPFTRCFDIDQINATDDSSQAKKWVESLDFKKIVPELIIKKTVHPFKDVPERKRVIKKDLEDLKKWSLVRGSVRDSVGNSVWDSVRDSVWNSVGDSIGDSVWDSVWDSVGDSVGDSVRASVWNSVGASVGASVYAYISSFFDIKYDHDYSCLIRLWEKGMVPSFDENVWRIHSGKNAKIIWKGKI